MTNLREIIKTVKASNPLVHCITNPISINQCANAVLCTGARPIMAEHPKEVSEITRTAKALVLNTGNITDVRMEAMQLSADAAVKQNIPIVLDAVGAACSELRRDYVLSITEAYKPDIIKGNYSEIYALYNPDYKSAGVDSDLLLDEKSISDIAVRLAEKCGATILVTGKTDIITDGKSLVYIKNGVPQLSNVTGTGCMLGMLCGCYITAAGSFDAAIAACAVLGICGELSVTTKGSGSFMVNLLDNLSALPDDVFEKNLKLEEKEIEEI